MSAFRPPLRRPVHRSSGGIVALTAALLLGGLTACGYGSDSPDTSSTGNSPARAAEGEALSADEVSIGYFANITHGTALVGLAESGPIREELAGTALKTQVFNAGPSAIEALNAGAVDITFIGPNPAINGYVQSGGRNLRIVAGAASGGASLVVNPDNVENLEDLEGKRIATPQLGNTQDVALLNYLDEQGFEVDGESGTGDVTVLRIANAEIPPAFENGSIDGAWVPEPTAAKLVSQGAVTLLDEGDLWEDGRYVVTHVIASQEFLADHPDVVEAVIRGVVRSNALLNENPEEAKETINSALEELSGAALPDEVLDPAFEHVEFLNDPLAKTLSAGAEHAVAAGLLDEPDLTGIYDLRLLNKVLAEAGEPKITEDAGLGIG
ncbi:aliphatic sulfonate ABC transporter substrate-binding protein [Streptomyces alkaliphilus]|uniref:Aliphatic sulfonate ABC transporter substrate-binding protein n=1 Tax=Streptomyces alkaliphilus TaxID=1472722 RepID=A0A7W3TH19_9ACTN|nr:aliphatic sulfonate ABC transporter substrate-binding protein [Streptomyces alkaliphilus]MBB0246360.1 aliphatic sulfonate ABC transporter substrate-binding protein [Streptomyces alkaliphilus]